MTRNRSQLINFVNKFLGTVRFGNDQIAKIMGYDDYQMGNVTISQVYYVEGLGHNLFSVGQYCHSNLEVAFRKHTCYIRDLEGVDLLKGSRGSNLYTLSLEDMMLSSPICLLSKASKTNVASQVPVVVAPEPADPTGTPSSTSIDQVAPSLNNDPFFGVPIPEPHSKESSLRGVILTNVHSNYKEALKESCWVEAMQEELNEFERLEVWELVPPPDRVMIITLKWIFKVILDDLGGDLDSSRLSVLKCFLDD
ncbi:integrase, catalytic region, zinc finger, CCHC-type containing protein [Tanacetum coccineum]